MKVLLLKQHEILRLQNQTPNQIKFSFHFLPPQKFFEIGWLTEMALTCQQIYPYYSQHDVCLWRILGDRQIEVIMYSNTLNFQNISRILKQATESHNKTHLA